MRTAACRVPLTRTDRRCPDRGSREPWRLRPTAPSTGDGCRVAEWRCITASAGGRQGGAHDHPPSTRPRLIGLFAVAASCSPRAVAPDPVPRPGGGSFDRQREALGRSARPSGAAMAADRRRPARQDHDGQGRSSSRPTRTTLPSRSSTRMGRSKALTSMSPTRSASGSVSPSSSRRPSWDTITAGSWGGRWDISVGSMTITVPRQARSSTSARPTTTRRPR